MEATQLQTKPIVDVQKIPFEQVAQFSERDKAYVNTNAALRPFYKYDVSIEAFQEIIATKSKEGINRRLLVDVLKKQYANLPPHPLVAQQVESLLSDNTFTVITAHQPSLFTGPLYYIYKIISTLNLAKQLKTTYPNYHFVPVFITGGEDHDFEEMNHVQLFGKQLLWENEEKGSVGMMQTDSLQSVLEEAKTILGNSENAQEIYQLLLKTHTQYQSYSEAAIAFAHELFKEDGLVILNMNQGDLKRAFIPILWQELTEQVSQPKIQATQAAIEKQGFKAQAFPRKINLFYLKNNLRERIVWENGRFEILNTDLHFSKNDMKQELENHPERFSPNVNLRPLYQEFILPNLAYIGGGGELAYWMERQSQFEYFGVNFPMLIRRNSVLWIDKSTQKRFAKLGLSLKDLLFEEHQIIKKYLTQNSDSSLSLEEEKHEIQRIFEQIAQKAAVIDPSLKNKVLAQQAKQQKVIEQLEGRLVRAEKQKHETTLNQIKALKEKLFPNNSLQERVDNFIPFFLQHGWAYFEVLKEHLHPLEKGLVVIEENL